MSADKGGVMGGRGARRLRRWGDDEEDDEAEEDEETALAEDLIGHVRGATASLHARTGREKPRYNTA